MGVTTKVVGALMGRARRSARWRRPAPAGPDVRAAPSPPEHRDVARAAVVDQGTVGPIVVEAGLGPRGEADPDLLARGAAPSADALGSIVAAVGRGLAAPAAVAARTLLHVVVDVAVERREDLLRLAAELARTAGESGSRGAVETVRRPATKAKAGDGGVAPRSRARPADPRDAGPLDAYPAGPRSRPATPHQVGRTAGELVAAEVGRGVAKGALPALAAELTRPAVLLTGLGGVALGWAAAVLVAPGARR